MLLERIQTPPPVDDLEKAEEDYQEFKAKLASAGKLDDYERANSKSSQVEGLLKSIFGSSSFLTGLILRDPCTVVAMLNADPENYLTSLIERVFQDVADASDEASAMRALRKFKQKFSLLIAVADIGAVWTVEDVTDNLTRCAETALQSSLRFLLKKAEEKGDYQPKDPSEIERECGYFVIGMGKFGAHELNYSSDIDLIVFYELGLANLKEGLEPSAFFVRLTRDLSKFLNQRTADGYVFRTDLRLRPDPGATQVAMSTDAGLNYYESFGQNWERAAYIKARIVAGDMRAGDAFLEELSPYVWRKYLDYAAIADIHAMKRQIHTYKGHGKIAVAGHNIKLGRGGIREIEFFVQTQQLIAGGRQEELRCRETLTALKTLAKNGWIAENVHNDIREAYLFLRHVEHRLQMIADEQTHTLPSDEKGLSRIAHFSGFADVASFSQVLIGYLEIVQKHYASLFEHVPELTAKKGSLVFTGDQDDPETVETLFNMGYSNPSSVISAVKSWHYGRYPATRSEKARERLTEVQPVLIQALSDSADPDQAIMAFDRFLSELPAGIQLFSLLRNNPNLLGLISDIVGTAPRLANLLSRRARLLDSVLDPGFFGARPSEEALSELVDEEIRDCRDFQDTLDQARNVGQEQSFLIGVRLLSGAIDARQAGEAFAALAGHLIDSLKWSVEKELERAHGKFSNGASAVIAMGKLGGREMTASSDLDLIIVYDHDAECLQSSGVKPLSSTQYFSRLTQRLISALSAPTAEGKLYDVDMRLRPSGNAGPVAAKLESFIDYQENRAWTWEHMALTRARTVSGPQKIREDIDNTIKAVLCRKRDPKKIAADVIEMRQRISDAKPSKGLWDLKFERGGLVDLEFIAQYLQLVSAHDHPDSHSQNTYDALVRMAKNGILSGGHSDILIPAAEFYNSLTQIQRLCLKGEFVAEEAPEGLRRLLARAVDEPDFSRLDSRLADTNAQVLSIFNQIISDQA